MKISIVIPCYNEKNTIEKIVAAVCTAPIENKEIIVVDDCSQDGTQAVLKERLQTRNVELCSCADRWGDYCYTNTWGLILR